MSTKSAKVVPPPTTYTYRKLYQYDMCVKTAQHYMCVPSISLFSREVQMDGALNSTHTHLPYFPSILSLLVKFHAFQRRSTDTFRSTPSSLVRCNDPHLHQPKHGIGWKQCIAPSVASDEGFALRMHVYYMASGLCLISFASLKSCYWDVANTPIRRERQRFDFCQDLNTIVVTRSPVHSELSYN